MSGRWDSHASSGEASYNDLAAAGPLVLVLALAAQFGFDFASSIMHELLVFGVRPQVQLRVLLYVWGLDAALASFGFLAAQAAQTFAWAALAPCRSSACCGRWRPTARGASTRRTNACAPCSTSAVACRPRGSALATRSPPTWTSVRCWRSSPAPRPRRSTARPGRRAPCATGARQPRCCPRCPALPRPWGWLRRRRSSGATPSPPCRRAPSTPSPGLSAARPSPEGWSRSLAAARSRPTSTRCSPTCASRPACRRPTPCATSGCRRQRRACATRCSTTRSPAWPTGRCSATASTTPCAVTPAGRSARSCSSWTSTASSSSTTRWATTPATSC